MNTIRRFSQVFESQQPDTCALLLDGELTVHDAVDRITLHGSRGPAGGARPDSDIDLCLAVNSDLLAAAPDKAELLRDVLRTTLDHWHGQIEADLAAVFDQRGCGLACLHRDSWQPERCPHEPGCMGLYKLQKGFDGFVPPDAIDHAQIYPLIEVWAKEPASS